MVGFKRTLNVIDGHGLQSLGTYSSADENKWSIQKINNINIGMTCYTYATDCTTDGRPILNGGLAMKEPGLCNYFTYTNIEKFYSEAESHLTEMKKAGADATIIFIHWGEEYQLTSNSHQQKIAQKLCFNQSRISAFSTLANASSMCASISICLACSNAIPRDCI